MVRNTGQDFIIVGSIFVNSYVMQVQVSTLSDLPLQFMHSLLWELYELQPFVPTGSSSHQLLLYSPTTVDFESQLYSY